MIQVIIYISTKQTSFYSFIAMIWLLKDTNKENQL